MRAFRVVSKYKDSMIELPKRATKHSAGYDLSSAEDVVINPKEIVLVPTGIKCQMNENEALFVYPRSSLGIKKGLMMSNSVGIVDSDYYDNDNNEGHIFIPLYNFKDTPQEIKKGERIAQGVFHNYYLVDNDTTVTKRNGGFGSSGI